MRLIRRLPVALLLLISLVFAAAACGQTPAPTPAKTSAPTPSTAPASGSPGASGSASIATPWGPILPSVPATFPVFPSAASVPAAQVPGGPWSAAWSAPTGVTEVAAWYRDQLATYGFLDVELQPAAADGARVVDAIAGSAGCEAQVTIRSSGGSTMITVRWGSGCSKLGG